MTSSSWRGAFPLRGLVVAGEKSSSLNVNFDLFPNILYLGHVDHNRIPALLVESQFFVFPSKYAGEGHPGAVIEALCCGLPVIAYNWRAIDELVVSGKNGILVESRSSFLAAVQSLIKSDAKLQRLRKNVEDGYRPTKTPELLMYLFAPLSSEFFSDGSV